MKYLYLLLSLLGLAQGCHAGEKWVVAIVSNPRLDYWKRSPDLAELHIPFHEVVADFNGDGLPDRAYSDVTTSGTGGSGATIYLRRKDGRFACVGSLGFGSVSVHPEKNGQATIFTSWRFGGGDYGITKSRISFAGITTISEESGNTSDPKWETKMAETFKKALKFNSSVSLSEKDLLKAGLVRPPNSPSPDS